MAPAGLDSVIPLFEFRMLFGFYEGICNLDEKRFQIATSAGNPSGFDFPIALVIAGTAASPGNKMLRGRKHRHVRANLRENGNGRHRILVQPRKGAKQVQSGRKGLRKEKDFLLNCALVGLKLVDV